MKNKSKILPNNKFLYFHLFLLQKFKFNLEDLIVQVDLHPILYIILEIDILEIIIDLRIKDLIIIQKKEIVVQETNIQVVVEAIVEVEEDLLPPQEAIQVRKALLRKEIIYKEVVDSTIVDNIKAIIIVMNL